MSKSQNYRLKVGEKVDTKLEFFPKLDIIYAGMPNPNVFSIAVNESTAYQSWAYNLYFPKPQTEILFEQRRLHVKQVTPEEFYFSISNR